MKGMDEQATIERDRMTAMGGRTANGGAAARILAMANGRHRLRRGGTALSAPLTRLSRLMLAAIVVAGAVGELVLPWALARAARSAEARDLVDCQELPAGRA